MASNPQGLGAKFDAHNDAEFKTRDIDATIATMGNASYIERAGSKCPGGRSKTNSRRKLACVDHDG